uniref:Uncharacterized protein n=1 Tax=Arundo donax TaxID=35708 RepID=A0A0A8ZRM4_ARUDO
MVDRGGGVRAVHWTGPTGLWLGRFKWWGPGPTCQSHT